MPRGPQGQKHPADLIGTAIRVAKIATGEMEERWHRPLERCGAETPAAEREHRVRSQRSAKPSPGRRRRLDGAGKMAENRYIGGTEIHLKMEKLEEAVHYICSICTEEDRLGAVKLNKILYYSDMIYYAKTGTSITGASYAKRQRGPAPKQIRPAMEHLRQQMRLDWKHVPVFEGARREFDAHGETNLSLFSADEIKQIDAMIRFVCDQGAADVSEFSHTIVWGAADIGEELPYDTFLVSYLREPDDAQLRQAAAHLADIEKQDGRVYA